jgi:hypothetical protein
MEKPQIAQMFDFEFRISNFEFSIATFGNESRATERAIFKIVGPTSIPVGKATRANNVEGGDSREARSERRDLSDADMRRDARVHRTCRP